MIGGIEFGYHNASFRIGWDNARPTHPIFVYRWDSVGAETGVGLLSVFFIDGLRYLVSEMLKRLFDSGLWVLITVIAGTASGVAFQDSSLAFSDDEDSFPTSSFSISADAPQGTEMTADIPENPAASNRAHDASHPGPENLVKSSPPLGFDMSAEKVFPTVHSDDDSAVTSSAIFDLANGIEVEDDKQGEVFAPKEVVVIAICVVMLSLVMVVLAVVMTFLIRRRMRRKAYLRVKHASQTELAVHYVQNTPASAAARDAAMEQLFQSLASIDPETQAARDYCRMNCGGGAADDRCLSPTDSIASVDFGGGGKPGKACSRSMPSLKNLNAHEEALSCNITSVLHENSGKFKGRSRSFTERAALGVDVVSRAKMASRSHSEKLKNRVILPTAGKRFEKKSNKANRRSAPSFFRLAKFGLLRTHSKRQKAADAEADLGVEEVPCMAHPPEPTDVVRSESKRDSSSLLDFEMPNVSPIFQDIGPMLTALHHHHHQSRTSQLSVNSSSNAQLNEMRTSQTSLRESNDRQQRCKTDNNNGVSNSRVSLQSGYLQNSRTHHKSSDVTIYVDAVSEVDDAQGVQKVPSIERVRDENLGRSHQNLGKSAIESARKAFSSVGHLQTSCKDVSVGNHNKQTIS